jgi:hypothetical protein
LKKYLGGGNYRMAVDGLFWGPNRRSINVAIKLYIEGYDPDQEIHREVSKKFPDLVATFYFVTKSRNSFQKSSNGKRNTAG